jgi:hypothetical protein
MENEQQTQSGLRAVMTSLNHRIQRMQIDTQIKKARVETTHHGLDAKIAEFLDDFVLGYELIWFKFGTQLQEFEAQVAHGVDGSTGIDASILEYTKV